MFKKLILYILLLAFITPLVSAQEDCSVLLRRAQKYYDDGIIEEVPALLKDCINDGFTKEEKIDAYKLLILCSIYEDNIEQAEKQMLTFLKANPQYEINTSVDAAEFIHFFNSYKTTEIISLGFTAGTNFTNPVYREKFGTEDVENAVTTYSNVSAGFIMGPTFSRPVANDFEINLSVLFGQKKFSYKTEVLNFCNVNTEETQNYLEFPLSVSYYKYGNKTIKPFATAGINISHLLNSSTSSKREYTDGNYDDIQVTDFNNLSFRNNLIFSAMLGTGIELKFNKGSLLTLMRYNFGLNNIVNEDERYTDLDQVFKFYLIDDKVLLNNLYFSISYMYPLYNHKKINN